MDVWGQQLARAESVEFFFRKCHYPNALYRVGVEAGRGTMLVAPVETRWGSKVDLLQSLLHNRELVENTLGQLRREKFTNNLWQELGWVWNAHFWEELEHMCQPLKNMKAFMHRLHPRAMWLF